MRLFDSLEHFAEVTAGTRKWERTLEALHGVSGLPSGIAYSMGDSLTYRSGAPVDFTTAQMVGRRRYHQVVAAVAGEVKVEVAPQRNLSPAGLYDDLSDRQPFDGDGRTVTVAEGGLLVVDIGEAARVLPSTQGRVVELHVTVEGATFHNK